MSGRKDEVYQESSEFRGLQESETSLSEQPQNDGGEGVGYIQLSPEGKLWFALLVFGIVALDISLLLALNAARWRPRWEARFSKYVPNNDGENDEKVGQTPRRSQVLVIPGLCRMVEPIKKSIFLGCFTFDDRNIGDTRTNNSNHKLKQVVEYKFLMRYKYAGKTYEKFMKLKSPMHDDILPRANHTAELYVLSSNPELALLKKHVRSELQQFDYAGLKHKTLYKAFGLLGGKIAYSWCVIFFLLGFLGPTVPLKALSKDISFDASVWSRIVIVLVANIMIMAICNSDIQNKSDGYPIEFNKYVGHGKAFASRANQVKIQHPNTKIGMKCGKPIGSSIDIDGSLNSNIRSSISSSTGGGGINVADSRSNSATSERGNGFGGTHHLPPPHPNQSNHIRILMTGTVTRGRVRGRSPSVGGGSSIGSSISTLMDIKEEEDDEFEIVAPFGRAEV